MTATFSIPRQMTFRFLEFLRRELAPTPGRWQATFRITLACIACTVPIMTFHLEQPLLVMIGMFLVAKEDISTTLLGTVVAIAAATVACGLLLLFYLCAVDVTWLRVLGVPGFIALGLLLTRIVTIGPIGLAIGVILGFGMTIPDTVSSTETLNRFPFYFWWAWTLGLSVNLAVQFLLNPETSQSLLVRRLTSRLDAVEGLLRKLAAGKPPDPQHSQLGDLALAGVVEPLRLLEMTSVVEPWLKKNHARVRAQFIVADRLVTAAAVLETQGIPSLSPAIQERLQSLADACAHWRNAIKKGESLEASITSVIRESGSSDPNVSPSLAEMERAAELIPRTFPGRELPDELKRPAKPGKSGLLVPDAFSNPEYFQFAIKGALAGFICYLIFTLTTYPGIYTSLITCVVCSLSTIGASVQKGVLRFAGAAVGGVLGFICLMSIFPHLDSLGGFWLPFGAVTALAAYVNFGSARISYCGFQIGLAFFKCVLQSYGTETELRVVRDRLIGIALGLVVFGFINSRLWPVRALETLRVKLASALRSLAQLARLSDEKDQTSRSSDLFALRSQVCQDFASFRELFESAKFEPGAEQRERLEAIRGVAQSLFLRQLAIQDLQPVLPLSVVPASLQTALARFRAALGGVLLNLANRVEGKAEQPAPDLQSALVELEKTVAGETDTTSDATIAARVRTRLELYKQTLPFAAKLSRLQAG